MDEFRFDGRVAAVTGAHHGLGREYSLLLASRGAKVVVNDVQGAADTVAAIRQEGGTAIENTSDITTSAGTDQIVADALGAWDRLDIVVNNAAGGPIDTLADEEGSRKTMDVHYFGTQNMVRSAMPAFTRRRYGRIVNTSSGSIFGLPGTGSYAAGKGAVLALSRALARDLASRPELDIKVNVILPAYHSPNFPPIPDERLQGILEEAFTPSQVAPVVIVLAHDSCPGSGELIQAGGGRVSRVIIATTAGWQATDAVVAEEVLEHWGEITQATDLREPVGSMYDLFDRRGEYPYSMMDLFGWATTGTKPSQVVAAADDKSLGIEG